MVIVCGGSNDVNRDMSHIGLNSLEKFGSLRTNTKIRILALQPRHDLVQDSDGYTRHGQHFQSTGKSKVVQYIVQYLTKYATNSSNVSIPLKWKTSTSDFIPFGCEATGTNNNTSDLENDANEENQPITSNQNIRTWNGRKKLPPVRSHDFLWE